jgi:hypothetical protein
MTKHIAMWSGPRNISTAMMRSFENRPDTFVSDEPFYGFYLANTDIDHPGRKEVLRSMEQIGTQCLNRSLAFLQMRKKCGFKNTWHSIICRE